MNISEARVSISETHVPQTSKHFSNSISSHTHPLLSFFPPLTIAPTPILLSSYTDEPACHISPIQGPAAINIISPHRNTLQVLLNTLVPELFSPIVSSINFICYEGRLLRFEPLSLQVVCSLSENQNLNHEPCPCR